MARPNKKARRILGRVLRWLEAGGNTVDTKTGRVISGLDMAYGVEKNDCGTVCCLAGAVCQFEGLGELSSRGELSYFGEHGAEQLAVQHLGIPFTDARALFMPFDDFEVSSRDLTPAVAAATLLRYIQTGKVQWLSESGEEFRRVG